jgi:hypothetical protein
MKKPFIVRPTGLKGSEKINRMKELMGASVIKEDVKNSSVELTKVGPDGRVYGIVKEGSEYYIKVTSKTSNLVTEDFNYIGGLANKKSESYPSYAKAIKQLNLKFMSLNEAYGKTGNINVFEDDNLLTEHHPYSAEQKLSATKGMGDGAEYIVDKKGDKLTYDAKEGKEEGQFGDNVAEKDVDDEFEAVKLSENEMAIDSMLTGDESGLKGKIKDIFNVFKNEHPTLVGYAQPVIYKLIESIEHGDDSLELEYVLKQEAEYQLERMRVRGSADEFDASDALRSSISSLHLFFAKIASEIRNEGITEQKTPIKKGFSIAKAIDIMEDIVSESDKDIKVKGKDVKSAKQNGDTSYSVTFSDDTTDIIYVSHDDWDKLNDKYGNVNENLTEKNVIKFINSLTESEKEALLNTLKKKV